MSRTRMYREAIDGNALREELKARGVSLMDASAKIGYEASYLSKATRDGLMPRSTMLLLQAMYNIDPEIYRIKKKPENVETSVVEVVQHTGLTDDDLEKLYKVIYSAAYKAIKQALDE